MAEKYSNSSKQFSVWTFSLETIIWMGISVYDFIGGWGTSNLLSENAPNSSLKCNLTWRCIYCMLAELVCKLSVTQMSIPSH